MFAFHRYPLALLPLSERVLLAQRSVMRRLDERDVLFLAGEKPARLYVVVRGVVKLVARDERGAETIIALVARGGLLGEVAVLDQRPQPLDAIAATNATVVSYDAEQVVDAFVRSPRACLGLAAHMAGRTRAMCDLMHERSAGEASARLAGRLLDLARLLGKLEKGAVELELPVRQKDLGAFAGMSREMACKTLRRLQDEGVLHYKERRLRILRPDTLEQIRCGARVAGPSR